MSYNNQPKYIGLMTEPKDRSQYKDAFGYAFVMTDDVVPGFQAEIMAGGHSVYGHISDPEKNVTNFSEKMRAALGDRATDATGVLVAINEYAGALPDAIFLSTIGREALPTLE